MCVCMCVCVCARARVCVAGRGVDNMTSCPVSCLCMSLLSLFTQVSFTQVSFMQVSFMQEVMSHIAISQSVGVCICVCAWCVCMYVRAAGRGAGKGTPISPFLCLGSEASARLRQGEELSEQVLPLEEQVCVCVCA